MARPPISENKVAEAGLRFLKKITPSFLLDLGRPLYHFSLALLSAIIYRFPSRRLFVIGVTGTKGKSTVVELLGLILRAAGKPTATLSSVSFSIGQKVWPNELKMTVPGRFKLQGFLRQAVNEGAEYLVLEMTSEAIRQSRHRFIRFGAALLTNFHAEHIETHGSFAAYRQAKAQLFRRAKGIHVLNLADSNFSFFNQFSARKKAGYYLEGEAHPGFAGEVYKAEKITFDKSGSRFEVSGKKFQTKLIGRFNVANILCAVALSRSLDIPWEVIQQAAKEFVPPPGRLELIDVGQDFGVVIDFAHTPESLAEVYKTVKEIFRPEGLICVLGSAGGGRDKWKRPVMAKIAIKNCREVIFTNEDPYDENPEKIIDEMVGGIPADGGKYTRIIDRAEAIRTAIRRAEPGSVVVITGKGGERWLALAGGKKIPWSDTAVAEDAIRYKL